MNPRKVWSLIAITGACSLLSVGVAAAADPTDVTVTGTNSVDITSVTVGDFTGVTLDGTAKSTTATMSSFSVTDARGTGAGWHVTAQGSRLAEHDGTGYVTSGKQLPLNSLTVPQLSVSKTDSTSSGLPTANAAQTIDGGSAVTLASAASGDGMGSYSFDASSLVLAIPASTYAKTYRSDVTVSVVSGP